MTGVTAGRKVSGTVHFEVVGDGAGEPVLVLPGGGVRDPEYLGDLRRWGASRPLAVVHFRGTPKSGGLPEPWWNQYEDIESVRVALGVESVDVIAHSAGSRVALAYAASDAPVRRLALVTPPAAWLTGTDSDVAELAATRADEPYIAEALTAPPLGFGSEAAFREQQRLTAPLGYARWDEQAKRHAITGSTCFEGLRAFFSAPPPDDLVERIRRLAMPVLVIGGAVDLLSGRAPVEALAAMLINGSVEMIPDCGHYPWIDQPDVFAQIINRWSTL